MKTIKEVMGFCNEFTFYDQYSIESVVELNHVRDRVVSMLTQCDHFDENPQIRVLAVLDDISLMIIDGKIENVVREINSLRVGVLQLLCLDELYKEEGRKEDKPVDIINYK